MSDEKVKKSRGPKRTAEEIAAEKEAWLLKHRWGGVQKAIKSVQEVRSELVDAREDAVVVDAIMRQAWKDADDVLQMLLAKLTGTLPGGLQEEELQDKEN